MKWKRPCTVILIAIFLLLVSSCAIQPSTPPTELPPANLRQPCPSIPKSQEDQPLPYRDLYQADLDLISQYSECATRHRALVDAIGRSATTKGVKP